MEHTHNRQIHTLASKHISAYSANIVRETAEQQDTHMHARTYALEHTHSW